MKGSRFLATVAPVDSEETARAFLGDIAGELPDATHHCWAWRIARPAIERAGDAGEPNGSVGRPILAQLTGRDVLDTAVVVSRWFGGTKLGVGGLVRAYGRAAAETLDEADLVPHARLTIVTVEHAYADAGSVERAVARVGGSEIECDYGLAVRRRIRVAEEAVGPLRRAVEDATAGRAAVLEADPDGG